MRKLFCTAIAALALGLGAQAQDSGADYSPAAYRSNEIGVSYGRMSMYSIGAAFAGIFGSIFTFGLATMDEFSSSGAIGLSYYHWLNPKFAIGAEATYEHVHMTFKSGVAGGSVDPSYFDFIGVMPSVKGRWIQKKHFGLYSKLSLGATVISNGNVVETDSSGTQTTDKEADVSARIALQVTPIGLEFGSGSLRGFIESGFGSAGMLCAGLRYSF